MEYGVPYERSTAIRRGMEATMTTGTNGSAARAMKLRLRDDLRAAMADRRTAEVAVLRTLLGAIDQAEAVAAVAQGREYASLKFGDPSVEVPRKRLSAKDVRVVVRRERDDLRSAADEYARLEQTDAAAALALKADILGRYLEPARGAQAKNNCALPKHAGA
jgi:uncharacterized protein YqeY